MPDLSVDTQGLSNLKGTMETIRTTLDATRNVVDGVRGDLGSGELYDSLDRFEKNWDDGRGQIDKNMEAVGEVLGEAAKAYDHTDTELANQLHEQFNTKK